MATPKKPKPEEPAGYVKTAVLANLFDTTSQWIGQLTRDGILKKHQTEAGPRYNIVESTRAYVKHLREKVAGREEKQANAEKESEKLEAEVRFKQARADVAEMEVKELQGQMHRSEDVEALTTDLVFTIRSMLVALPGRLAVDVAGTPDAATASVIIRREIDKVLEELSNYRYNPADYQKRVRERQKWADTHEEQQ